MAKKKQGRQGRLWHRDPVLVARGKTEGARIDPDQLNSFVRLVGIAEELRQSCDRYLATFGLSTGRLALLLILIETPQEPQSPSVVAERLGVTRATVTGLVNALDSQGLVHRRPDPHDGRKVVISISLRAREAVQQILPGYLDFIGQLMQKVEKKRLIRLDKILSIIEQNSTAKSK
ncbi:MarR family transcriptional regulator [candidate division GN15 bacterium]|nr:MarR family transcriptional regulator [candidate division GN15 bacterium]